MWIKLRKKHMEWEQLPISASSEVHDNAQATATAEIRGGREENVSWDPAAPDKCSEVGQLQLGGRYPPRIQPVYSQQSCRGAGFCAGLQGLVCIQGECTAGIVRQVESSHAQVYANTNHFGAHWVVGSLGQGTCKRPNHLFATGVAIDSLHIWP